jgi:hypothetical protein
MTPGFEEVVAHVADQFVRRRDAVERGMTVHRVRAVTVGLRQLKTTDWRVAVPAKSFAPGRIVFPATTRWQRPRMIHVSAIARVRIAIALTRWEETTAMAAIAVLADALLVRHVVLLRQVEEEPVSQD